MPRREQGCGELQICETRQTKKTINNLVIHVQLTQ